MPHGTVTFRNHTIRQIEIPTLRTAGLQIHLLLKFCVKKKIFPIYFRENKTCLSVGLLKIGHAFRVFSKTVYQWVATNGSYMSDMSSAATFPTDFIVFMLGFSSYALNC